MRKNLRKLKLRKEREHIINWASFPINRLRLLKPKGWKEEIEQLRGALE